MKFTKPKQPKSICVAAFPKRFKKLGPENHAATAGLRGRSASEAVRMEIYKPIREMFLNQERWCFKCRLLDVAFEPCTDVHHCRGRSGLLLFDIRYWAALCRQCHDWIGAHPDEAIKLGLLDKRV